MGSACSLTESQLVDRMARWRRVASQAMSRHSEKGRIVWSYPRDEGLLEQLRELIAAEAECCSFMRFNIEEKPDGLEVELRVPDDLSDALTVMLGLRPQEPRSGREPASA